MTHDDVIKMWRNISKNFNFSPNASDYKKKLSDVRNNLYLIENIFFPKFCISVTNEPIWTKFSDTMVKIKDKTIIL